jgi:lipopolysaccharide transport system ATP-binding protein
MFMRLAFSVAPSVEPDILVIDEALSVGDGAFARRSFDRIMALKDGGATILFCSHAMYHIHALCERVLWLEGGRVRMNDIAPRVTAAYEAELGRALAEATPPAGTDSAPPAATPPQADAAPPPDGSAAIRAITASIDGVSTPPLTAYSGRSTLELRVRFASDPALPCPSVGVGIEHSSGVVVASAISANDGVVLARDGTGCGEAVLRFETLPLLRGDYGISVILGCERGLHVYEVAQHAVTLHVEQRGLEQGLVTLPHRWASANERPAGP